MEPDRELRREATRALYKGVGDDSIVWVAAARSRFLDHLTMCKARGYPSVLTESLLSSDITEETLNEINDCLMGSRELVHHYYKVLKRLLGVEKLASWDLSAPVPGAAEKTLTWEESKSTTVKVYDEFDSDWGLFVKELFEKRRVDVEDESGRDPWGICYTWYQGKTGFPNFNFNCNRSDLYVMISNGTLHSVQ